MLLQHITKILVTIALLLHLTGCLGGTADIMGRNRTTLIANASVEHRLSDRTSLEVSYTATGGSNKQNVGAGIQYDGTRITEGTLDNRYTLQALTANYDYRYFNGERLKLTIAPGITLNHAYIDSKVGEINPNHNSFDIGYGVKIGASLQFNDKLSLFSEANIYGREKGNGYASRGFWVGYGVTKNTRLQIGFSEQFYGDLELNNRDGCYYNQSTAEQCENSEFEIHSSGIQLGFKYFSK